MKSKTEILTNAVRRSLEALLSHCNDEKECSAIEAEKAGKAVIELVEAKTREVKKSPLHDEMVRIARASGARDAKRDFEVKRQALLASFLFGPRQLPLFDEPLPDYLSPGFSPGRYRQIILQLAPTTLVLPEKEAWEADVWTLPLPFQRPYEGRLALLRA